MSNPFEENNPWSNQATPGPRFGNAYEDDDNNAWQGSNKMPSPSDYRSTPTNWTESTKIEQPAPSASPKYNFDNSATPVGASENAYQFSGTRLGNQDFGGGDAYSKVQVENNAASPSPVPTPAGGKPRPEEVEGALPPVWDDKRLNPSKLRLLLRFLQFIAAVGHLGFAAGASPFSGEEVPFDSKACFYFLYAVAILTIIWAFFHIIFYLYRRVSHGNKLNRVLMTGTDLLLCILWGIGIIVEIAMFRCSPGGHSHWCDFYNVSIFWGFLEFVLFIVAVGWDFVGGCIRRK